MKPAHGNASDALRRYAETGHYSTPSAVIGAGLIHRAAEHMDLVLAGHYETGVAPHRVDFEPGDDLLKLRRVEQPHWSDRTILELVSSPALGEWAAAITGAKMVQVWNVQLLHKPVGATTASNVGWHQDKAYWPMWDGEVFTAWVALSDVTEEAGAMRFVEGSHRWGLIEGGDFWHRGSMAELREGLGLPDGAEWNEAAATLPPGAVSFHQCLTIHGSGPNTSRGPRLSFAIHLRTDRARRMPGADDKGNFQHLSNPGRCPVIWGEL